MIVAVLDVSLIMGLNIGETDIFSLIFAVFVEKNLPNLASLSHCVAKM